MAYMGVQSEGWYGVCESIMERYSCDVYIVLYGCYHVMIESSSSLMVDA